LEYRLLSFFLLYSKKAAYKKTARRVLFATFSVEQGESGVLGGSLLCGVSPSVGSRRGNNDAECDCDDVNE